MDNHYAPPQAYAADVSAPSHAGLQNAALERRLGGAVVDGIFLFAAGSLLSIGMAAVFGIQRTPGWAFAWMLVPQIANWYLIATRGQTIGKIVLKTRITRLDGSAPGFLHGVILRVWPFLLPSILVRLVLGSTGNPKDFVHFLPSILALVDIAFIFTGSFRCLHDLVASTRVVDLRISGPAAYGRGPW
jgi:uncharacterized RDD family membrane protein YckC